MRNYSDNRIPPAPQRQVKKLKTINKRMNDLDDIAQTYAGKICGNDEDSNYNAWFNVYKKKFAELIVLEMCGLMEQAEDDAYHCFEPSERPVEYIKWLNDWQERFVKHFGVEE